MDNGSDPTPIDVWSVELELVKCKLGVVGLFADAMDLEPFLPEGFAPAGAVVGAASQVTFVTLATHRCEGVVIDNETVLSNVGLALTRVLVRVNETLQEGGSAFTYMFELFTDNELLLDVFARAGFPARRATIELEPSGNTMRAAVAVGGSLWYEATGVRDQYEQGDTQDQIKEFHVPAASGPVWALFDVTQHLLGLPDGASLTVNEGFLTKIKPASEGQAFGTMQEIDLRGRVTFGRI